MTITLTTFRNGFILLPYVAFSVAPMRFCFGWLFWAISLDGADDEE